MFNSFLGNINAPLICKKGLRAIEDESEIVNSSTYFSIFQRVLMLSARRFKWTGLPDGVPDWWIETNLFYYDKICGYIDRGLGDLILPCFNSDAGNVYYMPRRYNIFGLNYNKDVSADDVCVLWNNFLGTSMLMILDPIIHDIYESTRAKDMNMFNNKIPVLYKTSAQKELSVRNLFNRVRRNIPATLVESMTDIDPTQVLSTGVPYLVDKIDSHIQQAWSNVLTVLGIRSSNIEKGERVQTAEVQAGNEQVLFYKKASIECREKFCEECNAKFGWNLSVEWIAQEEEDLANGTLYNDVKGYAQDNPAF